MLLYILYFYTPMKQKIGKWIFTVVSMILLLGIVGNISQGAETYTQEDMNSVAIQFCNDGIDNLKNSDTIYVEPWSEKTLCLYVANASTKEMMFEYGFTLWKTTTEGIPICEWNEDNGNSFSMLIPKTQERTITIDPLTRKTLEEKIVVPPGMSGLQLWCLIFKLVEPANDSLVGWMFKLVVRKSRGINIMIGGESTVNSKIQVVNTTGGVFSTNKKIKAELGTENNLQVKFLVANEGNISQKITITGKIYNILWFQKDFIIESKQLDPGTTSEFVADAGILPIYKWLFTVKFNVQATPQFAFAVTDETLKAGEHIQGVGNVFVFSWILVIIALLLLWILYKLLFSRKKITTPANTNVPQPNTVPPQNPTPSMG